MPDRPPLDAVLFDAGGTLVRLDFEWMAATLRELGLTASSSEFRRAELAGRRRYDASRMQPSAVPHSEAALGVSGDTRAYFAAMVEHFGADEATVARALERFFERHAASGLWTRPMEGARATLDAIASMGLAIAVVSNSDGRAARHLADCGVLEGVAFVVDSHEVGIEKPDPGIFRIALERLGLPPSRALFVGDILSVDEVGARNAGTRFVLIDPEGGYAPTPVASIPSIAALPEFVSANFMVAPGRGPEVEDAGSREAGDRLPPGARK